MTETDQSAASPRQRPIPRPGGARVKRQAEMLKERIYVTFTLLAVTIIAEDHLADSSTARVAFSMLVTVVGTLLAIFVADVIAHLVSFAALPNRAEIRHMLTVSFGSLSILVTPMILLALAALGVLSLELAVLLISLVLVGTLAVITLVAVARVDVSLGTKTAILLAVVALGAAVLALETIAH